MADLRDPHSAAWLDALAEARGLPPPGARTVYAVRTTGIYCRPTCPSRRPLARNVTIWPDGETARTMGFRPCRRCRPG